MGLFATVLFILDILFWAFLISVAGIFIGALIRGTIEDIRDHRRILATRVALAAAPPPSAWEGTIWLALVRRVRQSLRL